jgi:hypothetical protein
MNNLSLRVTARQRLLTVLSTSMRVTPAFAKAQATECRNSVSDSAGRTEHHTVDPQVLSECPHPVICMAALRNRD